MLSGSAPSLGLGGREIVDLGALFFLGVRPEVMGEDILASKASVTMVSDWHRSWRPEDKEPLLSPHPCHVMGAGAIGCSQAPAIQVDSTSPELCLSAISYSALREDNLRLQRQGSHRLLHHSTEFLLISPTYLCASLMSSKSRSIQ